MKIICFLVIRKKSKVSGAKWPRSWGNGSGMAERMELPAAGTDTRRHHTALSTDTTAVQLAGCRIRRPCTGYGVSNNKLTLSARKPPCVAARYLFDKVWYVTTPPHYKLGGAWLVALYYLS